MDDNKATGIGEPPESEPDNLEMNLLTPQNAVFAKTAGGFLSLSHGGKNYDRVAVYRTFPFTEPAKFISIREFDQKANEIGLIEDLNDFPSDTKTMLEAQLSMRYFTPKITRILNVKEEYGYSYFDVMTDKGACRFTIRSHEGGVTRLSESRLLIRDIDGNRFEIPDVKKLSAQELRKIDIYI